MKQQFIPLTLLAHLLFFFSSCVPENSQENRGKNDPLLLEPISSSDSLDLNRRTERYSEDFDMSYSRWDSLDQIYSADGEALGFHSELKQECMDKTAWMFHSPLMLRHGEFCDCFSRQVLPEITKRQYVRFTSSNFFHPALTPVFSECVKLFSEDIKMGMIKKLEAHSQEWPSGDTKRGEPRFIDE